MTSTIAPIYAPLTLEDAADVAELLTLCDAVDGIEEPCDEETAVELLSFPSRDLATDSLSIRQAAGATGEKGRLIGMMAIHPSSEPDEEGWFRAGIDGCVHPDHRRRGYGDHLFEVAETRIREIMAHRHPGSPFHIRASGGVAASSVRPLLAARGYEQIRTWFDLRRELPGAALTPAEIAGVRFETAADADQEDVRRAHNEVFRDHWGSTPVDSGLWSIFWESPKARNQLSTIARDESGEILAYVLASEYVPGDLHLNLVGTRRTARGRGIARAALEHTVALAAQEPGLREVTLEVDSASPTGATRLYERVGFVTYRERVSYQKDVDPRDGEPQR